MSLKWFKSRLGKKIIKEDLRRDLEYYLESTENGSVNIIPEIDGLPDFDTFRSINTDGYTIIAIPIFVTGLGIFQWDPTSILPDNGSTVIRPIVGLAKTGPGRWLIQDYIHDSDPRLSNDRTASGIRTTSTIVSVSSSAAPTAGQILTAINDHTADWETIPAATESIPGTMSPVDKAKLNLLPNPSAGILTLIPTDAATQIHDLSFSGLTSSKKYLTTVRSCITLNATGNPTHFGTADLIFSVSLLVNSIGVITAVIGNTPIESDHFSAGFFPTISAAASTNHILFSATRPTGEQLVAQAAVYVDPIIMVGDNLDSRLVAVAYSQNSTAYSIDGVSWVAGGNMPSAAGWDAVVYDTAHSLFVAIAYNSGCPTATSADGGVTWISASGAGGTQASGMVYDDFHGKLVVIRSGFVATSSSSDGSATWQPGGNLTSALVWNGLIYNSTTHRIHALENAGNHHNYTDDGGLTWNAGASLPASLGWSSGCHDPIRNRIIITASGSNQTYYSDDDMATWHLGGTLSSAILSWGGCKYFASTGRIIVNAYNSNVVNYSDDGGITWQVGTSMPSVKNWQSIGAK